MRLTLPGAFSLSVLLHLVVLYVREGNDPGSYVRGMSSQTLNVSVPVRHESMVGRGAVPHLAKHKESDRSLDTGGRVSRTPLSGRNFAHDPARSVAAPYTPMTASSNNTPQFDHYLPRDKLDRPPVIENEPDFGELLLSFPSRLVFDLLIERTGEVGGFIEEEKLAPELSEQLRKSFLLVRFSPGMLSGQPVPSRIRIELILDEAYVPSVSKIEAIKSGVLEP